MKRMLSVILIFFVLFWSACKKPVDKARVEIIDDVEYVHNIETPLHPNKKIAFEEDLSIGGEDETGKIILFRPRRFIVDQNENIYITDVQDLVIKVFDPNGKYLRTIGRKGEGPGEFKSIQSHAFLPDGRLLVMDYSAHRSSFFDSSGNFIESYQWKKRLSQLHFVTNSSYIVNEYTYEEAYDIFNKDGYYEAKVWLDKRPSLFVKGKMYKIEIDNELGYIFIKRYRAI